MKFMWKFRTERGALSPEDRAQRVQFVSLLAMILMELAFFLLEDRAGGIAYLYAERYLALPALAFAGASFCRDLNRQEKRQLYAGLAMVGLFFVIQTLHQVLESSAKETGTFVCAYALCFPFASATRDGKRQRGLKMMTGLFLAVGVLILVYAGMLLLNRVPEGLKSYVYWDGVRFSAMGHANICATLLMISIGLSAALALSCRKSWVKILLAILCAAEFAAMSLTNGRTTIIFTCLLLGGLTFCALRGPGWKRLAAALAAAVLVMGSLFAVSRGLYQWNQNRLMEAFTMRQVSTEPIQLMQAESEPPVMEVVNQQSSFGEDLKTLNGRTTIWQTALHGLRENPRILLIGTEYVEMIMTRYSPAVLYHTHNSWLEALYRMGLPGLAAALALTALAVWSAADVLWRSRDLWKCGVALLTLCLLGCALLEPYLFVADVSYHYLDFLFLLCLGYLNLWRGGKAA